MDVTAYNAACTVIEHESSIGRSSSLVGADRQLLKYIRQDEKLPDDFRRRMLSYAKRCEQYLEFGYDVDDVIQGAVSFHMLLEIRYAPTNLLRKIGFDDVKIIYTQKHLLNAIAPKDPHEHQHGFSIEQIRALPELIEHPVLIFDEPDRKIGGNWTKGRGIGVLLNLYDSDGIPAIAHFRPSCIDAERNSGRTNILTSVYGKEYFDSYLYAVIKQNKVLYKNQRGLEYMIDKTKERSPRFGESLCSPALTTFPSNIVTPSKIINKIREQNGLEKIQPDKIHQVGMKTMTARVDASRKNRVGQDRNRARNVHIGFEDQDFGRDC